MRVLSDSRAEPDFLTVTLVSARMVDSDDHRHQSPRRRQYLQVDRFELGDTDTRRPSSGDQSNRPARANFGESMSFCQLLLPYLTAMVAVAGLLELPTVRISGCAEPEGVLSPSLRFS